MDNLSSSLDLVFGALADPTRRAVLERLGEGDAMEHLVVSLAADPHGFVDEFLAKQGRSRRIALTVPNFMLALAVIAETDLISALPRTFVAMHGEHFGIVSMEAPLPLDNFRVRAVAPRVAMMDSGLAWLFNLLARAKLAGLKRATRSPARKARS